MGHNIGENIRALRKEQGLTQLELAEKAGVNVQTIRSYESGKYKPKREAIQSIAKALRITPECLQGIEKRRVVLPERLTIVEIDDPDLGNIQYRIEAADEAAYMLGVEIFQNAGLSVDALTAKGRIATALEMLNEKGQAVAVERVEELTKIPDYQRQPEKKE
ncbi:MAG: helix-turn-helix transcriptional regulator [Oscillospiraceae bacterium]|nr:helix-turn-helix transcriptional regulator [Oscillospiraceae bacterium]